MILSYGDKKYNIQEAILRESDPDVKKSLIQHYNPDLSKSDFRFTIGPKFNSFNAAIGYWRETPLSLLQEVELGAKL